MPQLPIVVLEHDARTVAAAVMTSQQQPMVQTHDVKVITNGSRTWWYNISSSEVVLEHDDRFICQGIKNVIPGHDVIIVAVGSGA